MNMTGFPEILDDASITLSRCADRCKEECTVFLQREALNSGLWILYLAMFLITAYWILRDNERFKAYVIARNPCSNVNLAIDTLLTLGIIALVAYIAIFIIRMHLLNPLK